MIKKNIILIVTILLIMTLMTGCERDTEQTMADKFDFDGETVVYGSYFGFSDYQERDHLRERVEEVEELFNVNIEFLDLNNMQLVEQFISSVKSREQIVDIIEVPRSVVINNFYAEDILYPLNELLDDDYFDKLPPYHQGEKVRNYLQIHDDIYMFSANGGHMEALKIIGNAWGILWNRSFFAREGLPDLYELYDKGEWTWDQMLEIASQATRDTTGDGNNDQWGLSNWAPWQSKSSLQSWFLSNNIQSGEIRDGKVYFNLAQEEVLDTLEFLKKINDYRGRTGESDFLNNRVGMIITPLGFAFRAYEDLVEAGDEDQLWIDLGIIPMPGGPASQENIVYGEMMVFALPITVENPEAKLELTNALFQLTADYRDMDQYIQQVIDIRKGPFSDEKAEEVLYDIFANWQAGDQYFLTIPDEKLAYTVNQIVQRGVSPAHAVNQLEAEIQSVLDEIF